MRSCDYWCRLGNIWVLKMRIVPANTKPLFCRTRLPPCQVGRVHKHMHYISNSPAMQGVSHNVQIQDYVIKFVILKPIQTKRSVCFDPIIYPPGSHQLAGRLVCLQLHMDSWCVPSGVATWATKGGKGAFNSVLLKQRVSHFRNIPWHAMYSFHLDTSPSLSVVRKFAERHQIAWIIFEWPKQVQL